MPIAIRDDAVFIILEKINDFNQNDQQGEINFSATDFTGLGLTKSDLLGHLDYLNQRQYIDAEFTGNAYGNQEDVPSVVDSDEVGFRVANTFGAEDGPLPHLITFKRATLTEKGKNMLKDMEEKPPKDLDQGPKVPLINEHTPFLEKVKVKGGLPDIYDARDITETVFRVMRDVMTTAEADRVQAELHDSVLPTDEKALQMEVADLWKDRNPIVGLLSRIRPPLKGPAPIGIDSKLFLTRVDNEAGVPKTVNAEIVVSAVFSATKDELSPERIEAVAQWLPEGKVREMWQTA
ncbi:DUF2267 domain-containing protein [Nodosilinea sp. LEGE 07298]|uniref:DUF2267 domain-containing protein n=1 Tax=Nodosilinea sp. LEGE 07298 TaxID=2777970 RepID=UPI0018807E1C|nr:DUF2267 domain-containing protein [Nodosilinea sp. LEGE 07298]MBE9110255.1 DUF2267 domain-containing protein [Nodosilinea sp. LEGE 07298]